MNVPASMGMFCNELFIGSILLSCENYKKSDFITRDMRSFSGRYESVRGLKLLEAYGRV